MAGLCGVVGRQSHPIAEFARVLRWRGSEEVSTASSDWVSIGYVDHPIDYQQQPSSAEGGNISVWVWGQLLGHEYNGKYTPRDGNLTDAEYCARLFNRHGLEFVDGLNSEFAGVIVDASTDTVSLFTDRLGSRPLYYKRASDGSLVFSSLLQSLGSHPDVHLEVKPSYLTEFLEFGRALGTRTPIDGVHIAPPGSVLTLDRDGQIIRKRTYWRPITASSQRPYAEFVDEFQTAFTRAVQERARANRSYGLLMSGGFDSRAILASLDTEVTAIHLNEDQTQNKEAQIARRSAAIAGAEFKFLTRESDYYERVLDAMGPLIGFNGYFHSAKTAGFANEIAEAVDTVFHGFLGGTLTSSTTLPTKTNFGNILSERPKLVKSKQQYINAFVDGEMGGGYGKPPFVKNLPAVSDVIAEEYRKKGDEIVNHEIAYHSLSSLVDSGTIYPVTNTRIFQNYEELIHLMPTHVPFLDNRVVDVILSMPMEYRYRHEIVPDALTFMSPELAALPHAGSGMRAGYPYRFEHIRSRLFYNNKAARYLRNASVQSVVEDIRDFTSSGTSRSEKATDTHVAHGSWVNKPGIIRAHPFVEKRLKEHKAKIQNSPYFDYEEVQKCYRAHLDGADYSYKFFALLTLLESSVSLGEGG